MVKIAIDVRMINHSGIGTYIQNLVPNLVNKYNLILLGSREILKGFEWYEKVTVINCKTRIYSIAEQFELCRKIPVCDIFISPHYNIPVLPVKAKKRIVVIHDVYHLAFRHKLSALQRIYSGILINRAVKYSDKIITISEFSESEIVRYTGIDKNKIKILYPGLVPVKTINEKDLDLTIKKYKLPENFILFVGNVKPHKNLKNLLLAYDILIKKNISLKLVITGRREGFIISDDETNNLLENNKTLAENILFTGYVEQEHLMNIYRMADVFVFPSFYEGFGIPPVEAMLAETPVIVSREASLTEVCSDAALYVDASSPGDIAEKIEMVISNEELKSSLIQKGRTNVLRFTNDKFQQGWEDIINENV